MVAARHDRLVPRIANRLRVLFAPLAALAGAVVGLFIGGYLGVFVQVGSFNPAPRCLRYMPPVGHRFPGCPPTVDNTVTTLGVVVGILAGAVVGYLSARLVLARRANVEGEIVSAPRSSG